MNGNGHIFAAENHDSVWKAIKSGETVFVLYFLPTVYTSDLHLGPLAQVNVDGVRVMALNIFWRKYVINPPLDLTQASIGDLYKGGELLGRQTGLIAAEDITDFIRRTLAQNGHSNGAAP